jgi:hypothetical protein
LAAFDEHINQAKRNLKFLESINNNIDNCYDWQATVCFYTSLHLVNAHLSKFNLQYRKHSDVNYALNFTVTTSVSKLPEDEYIAYTSLQSLSRRSRYLVNEKDNNIGNEKAFLTYEKHLAKAIKHLDLLISYFNNKYHSNIGQVTIKCSEVQSKEEFKTLKVIV